MSAPKHTPEPWSIGHSGTAGDMRRTIFSEFGIDVARCDSVEGARTDEPNAARIVACVNACEGIADPEHFVREVSAMFARCTRQDNFGNYTVDRSAMLRAVEAFGGWTKALKKAEGGSK